MITDFEDEPSPAEELVPQAPLTASPKRNVTVTADAPPIEKVEDGFHEEQVRVPRMSSKPAPAHEEKRAGRHSGNGMGEKKEESRNFWLRQAELSSQGSAGGGATDMEAIEARVEQLGSTSRSMGMGGTQESRGHHGGGFNSSYGSHGGGYGRHHGGHQSTSVGGLRSWLAGSNYADSDDEDEVKEERAPCCPWYYEFCGERKEKRGPCFYCFFLIFLCFLIEFPLFFVWLSTSPMPGQFWNERYEPFPVLENKTFITSKTGYDYNISLSGIPTTPTACNFSCIGAQASTQEFTAETSFAVSMAFSANDYPHTVFPVLLASNNFYSWWVAADRTDAVTFPFFPSNKMSDTSAIYRHTSEECTRPPLSIEGFFAKDRQVMTVEDNWAAAPTYVLVCVSWSWDSIQWHTNRSEMSREEMGKHCQAVGGVCGWPCGSYPQGTEKMQGCDKGIIDVDTDQSMVGGRFVPGANFQGKIDVRACITHPGEEECVTTNSPMAEWPCHKCQIQNIMRNIESDPYRDVSRHEEYTNKTYTLRYDSLPRMEVTLSGVQLGYGDVAPRAYILTTRNNKFNHGPDGAFGGSWRKLYQDQEAILSDPHLQPTRVRVEDYWEAQETEWHERNVPENIDEKDLYDVPLELDTARFRMQYIDQTKVWLNPHTCFAARGPLYIVACAVNSSTYNNLFSFQKGQPTAPPPFNDRCLAVTGVCGHACSSQRDITEDLEFCRADGTIAFEELFKEFDIPVNEGGIVDFFMITLIVGFTVKLMTYVPGLFSPDTHPQFYNQAQTDAFKYIAVVTPSGGESKAVGVRNLVGSISSLPVGCRCPFHVVFADEGHRHAHKMAFRALVAVLHAVPSVRMRGGSGRDADGAKRIKGQRGNHKEENLKNFTRYWTELSRTFRLKDCESGRIAKRIKELEEKGENKEEVKELNLHLDMMCGLEALRRCQNRAGWPRQHKDVQAMESAILRLRQELCLGEKEYLDMSTESSEMPRPPHLDDCEAHFWQPQTAADEEEETEGQTRLYTIHYCARAKPDEDERTLKVQHVARGVWYYRIPRDEDIREERAWLQWRERAQVYQDGDSSQHWFVVPLRTSRGKAGGLNFCENYLYDYTRRLNRADPILKPALYAIADARHQFQPDFFHETVPFFFKQNNKEVDPRIAFTQSPQYFPELKDDVDYLDNNNANFFRLNCMLRNCCGGVSSCGTNGTWLVRDRRAGLKGIDSIWETEEVPRLDFLEKIERRFFNESCKVEDTASSLDRVVKGKYSQYVNRRLSYGMAKDPVDYLAAVQRWAEGGVVLSLQTFFSCREGLLMVWMVAGLFILFILSLVNLIYGWGYKGFLEWLSETFTGGDTITNWFESLADLGADKFIDIGVGESWNRDVYFNMYLEVAVWFLVLCIASLIVWFVTTISYYAHTCPCCPGRKRLRRTRFPTSMAQWARLAITLDNLTYFLWFWTSFFWVGFNYYGVFFRRYYHFEAAGMVLFSYLAQVFGWSLVITATCRYRTEQGASSNEVFFLSLTNVWRTTQLFYITAPLILYSIIMGTSDMIRNRMLDVDISYWVGGDRGALSKTIAQVWTLFLIIMAIIANILYWIGELPNAEIGNLLIVTFIALDVMHPCCYLWLAVPKEELPTPPRADRPNWQRWIIRFFQLLFSPAFYRNIIRSIVFHPRSTHFVKWIGPIQNVVFPTLTYFIPELGVNQALLLLASTRT